LNCAGPYPCRVFKSRTQARGGQADICSAGRLLRQAGILVKAASILVKSE
jgi:hypothetical protein